MRNRKKKLGKRSDDTPNDSLSLNDIQADTFELWIGISRLMARVHGSRDEATPLAAMGSRRGLPSAIWRQPPPGAGRSRLPAQTARSRRTRT